MINLFTLAGIGSEPQNDVVSEGLQRIEAEYGAAGTVDGVDVSRLRAVLGNEVRLSHYRRVHAQYRAIASVTELLDLPGTVDSHKWRERCVEFTED